VLTRDPVAVDRALIPLGVDMERVEMAAGDVTEERTVTRTMRGADAVLHAEAMCTYDTRQFKRMWDVNARGTEIVMGAARATGVSRVVHASTVWALTPLGRVFAAASPVNRTNDECLFSKATADMIARHHQERGAPVVIAYEPALIGPHDPKLGGQNARLRDVLRGATPVWPTGGLPLGDVRDTAALYAALVTGHGVGARRFGPNRYLTTRQLLHTVRQATGRALPAVYLPAHAMLAGVLMAGRVRRMGPQPIQPKHGPYYAYSRASRVAEADQAAVPRPRPALETIADTVRWLRRSGLLSPQQAGLAGMEPTEETGGPAA
jgi:nucleoside-diphosphate-sugar epimerase